MARNLTPGSKIVAQELVLQRLLSDAAIVGGIYTMGYVECQVLTNDLWKKQAGGVPRHCFLLATAMVPGEAPDVEDEEVLLLRVIGPAPLPAEAELVQVREQAMREMVVARGTSEAMASPAILDVLTRNEIQFSGIRAKILGTFYESTHNGRALLSFGSDVETYYSSSRYKVYKPFGASLAVIASYPEATEQEVSVIQPGAPLPRRFQIGTVRYSSSSRRGRLGSGAPGGTAVPVSVNVEDFIALKTAVFGMTRMGKSNTMKTIATAVCEHAAITGQRIGQLLFDPAGEYANVNVQDQTALAKIGPEFVTIFRWGAGDSDPGTRPLASNFFDDGNIEVTWKLITLHLQARGADYIQSFLAADVIGPEGAEVSYSDLHRSRRRRCALYATLLKAGFRPPENLSAEIVVNKEVLEAVNSNLPSSRDDRFETNSRGSLRLTSADLPVFWDSLLAAREAGAHLGDWIDSGLDAILTVYRGSKGSGYRVLQPLQIYHRPTSTGDYAEEVLQELKRGKIVIVDLSLGSETVLQFCSERIINHVVQDAARRFAQGEEADKIQIFIEEAHRLFNRERMKLKEEDDPYVRLAKEAAKFRIGLIYATQEVTTVDPLILSNTSNWIVTHLNNQEEVRELSKYYDFEDFADLTLRAEDVGFCRLKTRSGRYIIPVQIDLFDSARIDAAREAALAAAQQAS
ncbi:MAG: hypothetical protein AMXMBFR61_14470 [Fimbriimonadales bacterium]